MKKTFVWTLLSLVCCCWCCCCYVSAAALDPDKVTVFGETDKNPVSYQPGELMRFTIRAAFGGQTPDQPYFLEWRRTGDDGRRAAGKVSAAEPFTLETSLDRPGFVHVYARLVDEAGKPLPTRNSWGQPMDCAFEGGAGVQPEKLQPVPPPADFDEFWAKQKARLAEVPLRAEMKRHPASTAEVTIYSVRVDCVGPRPVTGYLTIPVGAAPKSLPARGVYAGYGVGKQALPWDLRRDRIEFHVNAHGYDLDRDEAYYQDFENSIRSNGQIYAFDPEQNSDPEKSYFNGMALRVLRSLEFLRSLPEWNGRDLTAAGGSQGGLQAVWGASLDPAVTFCYIDIPWCCDLAGAETFQRERGWMPEYRPALGYYDTVNHGARVQCPAEIARAGLGDYTCPPSGVALLYNALKGPKKIVWVQGSTHGYVPPEAKRFVIEEK